MFPMLVGILALMSTSLVASTTRHTDVTTGQIHADFKTFTADRLQQLVEMFHGNMHRFVTISVTLTECETHRSSQMISETSNQVTLKEETCGTRNMQEWCAQLPGKTAVLSAKHVKTNTTALAEFRCALPRREKQVPETNWPKMLIPSIIVLSIIGILYNFQKLAKKTFQKTEKSGEVTMDSLESVNLDSPENPKKRTRIIRFDDETDATIGTLFTL